uniref:G-protein coupled receptors family 1 profile domain-containing protein n=1 Tax=Ascaris lumbricoides TaxID=6252 RepID=A0A9J2PEB5_ASCLU
MLGFLVYKGFCEWACVVHNVIQSHSSTRTGETVLETVLKFSKGIISPEIMHDCLRVRASLWDFHQRAEAALMKFHNSPISPDILSKMKRLVSIPSSLLFGLLLLILTIVGLVGNVVVIIAIGGDRKMRRTAMNMLLFNLAVADALNLITTTVEWSNTVLLGSPEWVLPPIFCPIARYLEITFLFASIMTQLIVCVERYIAIVYPIRARQLCSRCKILTTIFIMWIFVALFALPYAILHKKRPTSKGCHNIYSSSSFWQNYKWIEFASFYFLPCIIFVVLYSKVSKVLWAKNRFLQQGRILCSFIIFSKCLRNKMFDNVSSSLLSASSSMQEIQTMTDALKLRRNVVKMLVACVSVYFFCYSPIQGIFLSRALFEIHFSPPYEFILLMNALAMMCSACNPLLYTLFSKKFRARIARILWFSNGKRLPKRNDFSIVKVTANEPTGRLRLDWHHGDDFTPTHYCSESKLDMRSFKG